MVKVDELTYVPMNRVFRFKLPGDQESYFEMRFSMDIPNLEKAVQAFADAVWEGEENG